MSIINPSKHLYSGLVTSRCTHDAHILTSRTALSAVQELKIRRPNYSDFSVKTMVIMKLFQQQNGNTCFIIVLKVSFMGKYANYSIKEMK